MRHASGVAAFACFSASWRPSVKLRSSHTIDAGIAKSAMAPPERPAALPSVLNTQPEAASPPRNTTVSMKLCALYFSSG